MVEADHITEAIWQRKGLLPPPVGTSDWVRFSQTSYCVDKTLIIKDLIDSDSCAVLFTRPRRFGKTSMLNMLRAFYEKVEGVADIEKIGLAYFKGECELCREVDVV